MGIAVEIGLGGAEEPPSDRWYTPGAYAAAAVPVGSGTVYYVDDANGNDSYNGLYATFQGGSDGPFQTIGKALDRYGPLTAGDTVKIKAGTYRERPEIHFSDFGEVDRIYVGAFGDGPVIIDCSTAVTGWSQYSGNVYRASCAFTPTAVVVDDEPIFPEYALVDVDTEGRWYYDGSTYLYLWVPGGGDPSGHDIGVLEDDYYQDGFTIGGGVGYVTLYGLTIRFAGGKGLSICADHVRLELCRVIFNGNTGLTFYGYGETTSTTPEVIKCEVWHNMLRNWPRGLTKWGNWGTGCTINGPNGLIQGNVVHKNGGEGIVCGGATSNHAIRDNIAYDNYSVNIYANTADTLIERNFSYSNTPTLDDTYNNQDPTPEDGQVNKRLRPVGIGTGDEQDPPQCENITVRNNIIVNCRRGLDHYARSDVSGSGMKSFDWIHNTIVVPSSVEAFDGVIFGMFFSDNDGNNSDNVIANNIVYCGGGMDTWLVYNGSTASPPTDAFRGLAINYNAFYHASRSDPFRWGPTESETYDYTHAEWVALDGTTHGTGDVTSNPLLIDPTDVDDYNDMRTQGGSPARNAGTNLSVADDWNEAARDSTPTMGAWED